MIVRRVDSLTVDAPPARESDDQPPDHQKQEDEDHTGHRQRYTRTVQDEENDDDGRDRPENTDDTAQASSDHELTVAGGPPAPRGRPTRRPG